MRSLFPVRAKKAFKRLLNCSYTGERSRRVQFESLEDRKLMAVVWANQASSSNQFDAIFTTNAPTAKAIVNHAIADWNATLSSTTNLSLTITAGDISSAGVTTITGISGGRPTSANITLDNNAGGFGWFMDASIVTDSEFPRLVTPFSGNTLDPNISSLGDFYTTIAHEIGHALGYANVPGLSINQYLTAGPGAGQVTYNGPGGPAGVGSLVMTTAGGLHSNDPNDLMFATGTLGNRKLISDTTASVLAGVYGYTVPVNNGLPMLPSRRDTLHVNVDPNNQIVSVVGLQGAANDFLSFSVSTPNVTPNVPNSISISVGATTEFIPTSVQVYNVDTGDGNDTIYWMLDNDPNLLGTANLNMGLGNDAIFYQSSHATLVDFELRLVGNTIDRINRFGVPSPLRRVSYTYVETLNMYTGGGADLVNLSPSLLANPYLSTVTVTTYDGADTINASGSALPVEIYAGWGNDSITGSPYADIIIGDSGNDSINGGAGRDLIFGGSGLDTITANSDFDEDLLVSGTTSFDQNRNVLRSLRNEWTSSRTRAQRIANLSGTGSGGLNGTSYLNASTVFDDAAADLVFSQSNVDWFLS